MAEPAPIYDPDKKKAVTRPDLQALEGGGETSPPTGNLSPVPNPSDLAQKEKTPIDPNQVGRGYSAGGKEQLKNRPSLNGPFGRGNRKKLFIGGGATGLAALLIAGFLALLPLKILHIVQNLENRFFATSNHAMQKEANSLFSGYIKKTLTRCKGVTDKSCNPYTATNLVSRLYKGWRDVRLENSFSSKYGIEFKYEKSSGHYYLKTPSTPGAGVNIDEFVGNTGESLDEFIDKSPEFTKYSSRAEFRAAIKSSISDALKSETRYKQVMYRFKVGRLLEQKYGIRRCIFFCKVTDKFDDWKTAKKNAAKIVLTKKVLQPRNEMLGYVIECIFSDKGCDLTPAPKTTTVAPEGCQTECALSGEPISPTESEIRQKLTAYAANEGLGSAETIAKAEALYKDISDKGYANYLTKQFIEKVVQTIAGATGNEKAGQAASIIAEKATEKLPLIGYVWMSSNLINNIDKAGPNLQRLSYIINTTTMATTFSMYRTYADEIKTGHVDAELVGSMTDSLGPGNQNANYPNDKAFGDTGGAEQSPAYNLLIGNGSGSVPSGLQATHTTKFVTATNALHNNPEWRVIGDAAHALQPVKDVVSGIEGWVIAFFHLDNALQFLLGGLANALKPVANDLFKPLAGYLSGYILPPPLVTTNTSGAQMFGVMAGGADVAGNDFAHNGLGGKVLNNQQVTQSFNEQHSQDLQHYRSQSFFARLFDRNSDYSLISKLAMAMPSSPKAAANGVVASLFSNPFNGLAHFFSSIFNTGHAVAAVANCSSDRYTFSDTTNFYWDANPGVDDHGGSIVATAPDGAYYVHFDYGPGHEGQAQGSSDKFGPLPDYCDPISLYAGDPFHIAQYGYPEGPIIIPDGPMKGKDFWHVDHEDYGNIYCVSTNPDGSPNPNYITDKWNQDAVATLALDPNTKMPMNRDTTNPCLLIQATGGSAGALYDPSLLTPDDQAGTSSVGSPSTPVGTVSGNAQRLAQQILDNQKISKSGRLVTEDLQAAAAGKPGSSGALLSSAILRLIATLGQNHAIDISALESGGTGHTNNSQHYSGDAVDFDVLDGNSLTGRDSGSVTIINLAMQILPSGLGFGQSLCGGIPVSLSPGFNQFPDTCNHLHVQVPDGTP